MQVKKLIGFLLIAWFGELSAQITLEAAIDSALKNNLNLKNQRLLSEYKLKLRSTGTELPFTNLSAEIGQLNSPYIDTKLGLSQTFSFPSVYVGKKRMLYEEWNAMELSVSLSEAELRKNVSSLFSILLILKEKEKILLAADSLFTDFISSNSLRFENEMNQLERSSAELQRSSVRMQLSSVQSDIKMNSMQLQLLLNTKVPIEPAYRTLKIPLIHQQGLSDVEVHPLVKLQEQNINVERSGLAFERSRLLPEVNLGYYNLSFRGVASDNNIYNAHDRFSAIQLIVGLPLFYGAQKARINAAKIQVMMAENELQLAKIRIENETKALLMQHENLLAIIDQFEKSQLPSAKLIAQTATAKFIIGDISYGEWLVLHIQTVEIRSNYLDAIERLNENTISLNYMFSK